MASPSRRQTLRQAQSIPSTGPRHSCETREGRCTDVRETPRAHRCIRIPCREPVDKRENSQPRDHSRPRDRAFETRCSMFSLFSSLFAPVPSSLPRPQGLQILGLLSAAPLPGSMESVMGAGRKVPDAPSRQVRPAHVWCWCGVWGRDDVVLYVNRILLAQGPLQDRCP
jgi:hypothetical protein